MYIYADVNKGREVSTPLEVLTPFIEADEASLDTLYNRLLFMMAQTGKRFHLFYEDRPIFESHPQNPELVVRIYPSFSALKKTNF